MLIRNFSGPTQDHVRHETGMTGERSPARFDPAGLLRGGLGVLERAVSGAMVVAVAGSVDQNTSPRLGHKLQGLVERGERLVIVDLSGVERIDSSAIATLLDCLHHLWRRGGQMAVFGARPEIRAWFEVFMLDGVLRLCENEQQALESCLIGGRLQQRRDRQVN